MGMMFNPNAELLEQFVCEQFTTYRSSWLRAIARQINLLSEKDLDNHLVYAFIDREQTLGLAFQKTKELTYLPSSHKGYAFYGKGYDPIEVLENLQRSLCKALLNNQRC